jgi:ATP-dependent protease ClpP protease subunit
VKKATIYIYDVIGNGITSKDFNNSLRDLEAQGVDEFEIHINSFGGDVFEGMAIYNMLKTRNVTTYVDGIAASIASVIALSAKKVIMYKNTMMMIHNVWVLAAGDGNEMQKQSDRLKVINDIVVKIYQDKTGLPEDEIKALMNAETFLNANAALEKKFIDEIQEAKFQDAKEYVGYYVNIFDDQKNKKENQMNKLFLKFLGLAETATESDIQSALKANAVKFGLPETATLTDLVNKAEADAKANGKPADYDAIKAELATLKAQEETRTNTEVEVYVNQAVTDGKILPALKDQTITDAKKNFAAVKADIDKRAKNSAIPAPVKLPEGSIDVKDPKVVANAARAYIAEQKKSNIEISYTDAVNHIYKMNGQGK